MSATERTSYDHAYDGKQKLWLVTKTVTTVVGSFATYDEARDEWDGLIGSVDVDDAAELERRREGKLRSLAVEIVDSLKGYSVEFSNNPDTQQYEYEWVQEKLTELVT